MTVKAVIDKTDMLFPNVMSFSQKAERIKELELKIMTELFPCYEELGGISLPEEYKSDTGLLVPDAFSDIYVRYICLHNDIAGSDMVSYRNNAALFNSCYLSYMQYINRTFTATRNSIKISGG